MKTTQVRHELSCDTIKSAETYMYYHNPDIKKKAKWRLFFILYMKIWLCGLYAFESSLCNKINAYNVMILLPNLLFKSYLFSIDLEFQKILTSPISCPWYDQ